MFKLVVFSTVVSFWLWSLPLMVMSTLTLLCFLVHLFSRRELDQRSIDAYLERRERA